MTKVLKISDDTAHYLTNMKQVHEDYDDLILRLIRHYYKTKPHDEKFLSERADHWNPFHKP